MKVKFFLFLLFFFFISFANAVCTFEKITNIRFGPGERYRIKWPLYRYTPLRILKQQGSWIKIAEFNNEIGWLEKNQITREFFCAIVKVNKSPLFDKLETPMSPSLKKNTAFHSDTFKLLETDRKRKWAHVEDEKNNRFWIKRSDLWIY